MGVSTDERYPPRGVPHAHKGHRSPMSNPTPDQPEHDQDSEPSLNAPEEGRPDGAEASQDSNDDIEEHTS